MQSENARDIRLFYLILLVFLGIKERSFIDAIGSTDNFGKTTQNELNDIPPSK